jgi:hypothetical protein
MVTSLKLLPQNCFRRSELPQEISENGRFLGHFLEHLMHSETLLEKITASEEDKRNLLLC